MITPTLRLALEPIIRRRRLILTLHWSAGLLLLLAAGMAVVRSSGHPLSIPLVTILLVVLGRWLPQLLGQRWDPDFAELGRQIEQKHPELHASLVTAIEQKPDPETGRLSFLQQKVIADVLALARAQSWIDAVPTSRLVRAWVAVWVALFACLLSVGTPGRTSPTAQPKHAAGAPTPAAEAVTVTPGDTEIERGTGLVVLATFHRNVPTEATLIVQPPNQPVQRIALVKNLDDPVFGGGLPEVDAPFSYRVEYAGESTREFHVTVYEHPRLERVDATISYPAYTGLPEKQIADTKRVSAVEGSKLAARFALNKPVKTAELVAKDGTTLPLTVDPSQPLATLADFTMVKSQVYEVKLTDAEGRTNKVPASFAIDALPNKRPELKLITPRGDVRVSPLEEVTYRLEVWDDFGLSRYGLSYTVAGKEPVDVELGKATKADEKVQAEHQLALEQLGMKPDELISYYAWAEDIGPDGKARRTNTDLYFAEVRPFEEIYRPGDGSEGKEGKEGAGADAMKIAELQKQIISATWNLKRAEDDNTTGQKPSAKYAKDEPVIRDSQAEALKQATQLADKIEDPKSKDFAEEVKREMTTAHERLQTAEKDVAAISPALASEQSAYNALLKLAAHEFQIQRQQSQGKGKAQQRQQDQLAELEMKEDKKRYETKSEAESQQPEQQKEQLAILNRLKELAQRQQDINDRLKELQTALQAAKTEEQKDDIRRQLKRLKEEEQQLLSDLDETRQKMEQSSRQAQLADERKQLDQTRQEAQSAAESMEKNAPTEALAKGTRAARQLQQMRDDFRKKTSAQFSDEMRQMRNEARELAQTQKDISDKLNTPPEKAERRTLDGSSEREQLSEQLGQQGERLEKLTEDMKRVSEQAETSEPLLAKELYDTLRRSAQTDTGKTLAMTKALSERGYEKQAKEFEAKARGEIDEVKKGIEKAAESVLGDEGEALRQARAELDTLARELEKEVTQARPDLATNRDDAGQKPGEGKPGEKAEANANGKESDQRQAANGDKPGEAKSGEPATGEPKAPGGKSEQAGTPGEKPGQTAANQPGKEGQNPSTASAGKASGQGQQPGQGAQPGKGETAANASSSSQPSATPGKPGQQSGQQGGDGEAGTPSSRLADLARSGQRRVASGGDGGGGMNGGAFDGVNGGPLTGDNFVQWSDRLRNVEEMLDSPEMRREAAGIRELARGMRVEFKKNATQPDWTTVKQRISNPLVELRNRVNEELARRDSRENLVPIDRDPVPTQYAERVRRYYEDLGKSQ